MVFIQNNKKVLELFDVLSVAPPRGTELFTYFKSVIACYDFATTGSLFHFRVIITLLVDKVLKK